MKLTQIVLLSIAIFFLCSACKPGSQNTKEVEDQLGAWTNIQNAIAAQLQDRDGSAGYYYKPVTGAEFPLGTFFILNRNSPSGTCTFSSTEIKEIPYAPIPGITRKASIEFKASTPEALKKALSASVFTDLLDENNFKITYTDLKITYIEDSPIIQKIKSETCLGRLETLAKQPKTIIRGIVSGKLSISSTKSLLFSGGAETQDFGQYIAKFDSEGGFELIDKASRPQFFIYAKVGVNPREIEKTSGIYIPSVEDRLSLATPAEARELFMKALEENGEAGLLYSRVGVEEYLREVEKNTLRVGESDVNLDEDGWMQSEYFDVKATRPVVYEPFILNEAPR